MWSPADVGSLWSWHDASDSASLTLDGSSVGGWADKASAGVDLAQSGTARPTKITSANWGGRDVLSFDGGDSLNAATTGEPVAAAQGITIVAVCRHASVPTSNRMVVTFGGGTNYRARLLYANSTKFPCFSTWGDDDAGSIGVTTTPTIAIATVAADASGELFANGTSAGAFSTTLGTPTSSIGMEVGAHWYTTSTAQSFIGEVAEVLVFDDVLSALDRQQLEGYLAHKWGLEGSLPSGHPYKSAPPSGGPTLIELSASFGLTAAVLTSLTFSRVVSAAASVGAVLSTATWRARDLAAQAGAAASLLAGRSFVRDLSGSAAVAATANSVLVRLTTLAAAAAAAASRMRTVALQRLAEGGAVASSVRAMQRAMLAGLGVLGLRRSAIRLLRAAAPAGIAASSAFSLTRERALLISASAAGALRRALERPMSAASGAMGTVARQVGKVLAAVAEASASALRLAGRVMLAPAGALGALARAADITRELVAVAGATAAAAWLLARRMALAASESVGAAVERQVQLVRMASVDAGAAVARQVRRSLAGAAGALGWLSRSAGTVLAAVSGASAGLARAPRKIMFAVTGVAGSAGQLLMRVLHAAAAAAGGFSRFVRMTLAARRLARARLYSGLEVTMLAVAGVTGTVQEWAAALGNLAFRLVVRAALLVAGLGTGPAVDADHRTGPAVGGKGRVRDE